jgi:serine/threonine protein kinase
MNAQPETCNPLRVDAYLTEAMTRQDEADFLHHLESCSSCRQRIHQLAAEPSTWSDAEEFLRDQAFDADSFRTSSSLSSHDESLDGHPVASAEVAQVLGMLNPTDDPEMLGRLGGYEVSGVIGSGGMGVVLKAFDGPLDRTIAIKVLAPRLASSGAARRRFAREAKAAATVLHPNVIVIHGVSNDGKLPFLVMPCIRGESLQRRLDRHGPLQSEEILRIGQQVASGLAAAHRQGLVHRDIKPANILLEDGVERVTLTDFGLARAVDDASMTRSGVIAGTPQYMSPEQARGDNVDSRSDLFSLGSVMYAMCTGHPPFRAETSYGILRRITDTEPRPIREVNPHIPEWLERIVQRLLAKSPDDRMQTADDVAELFQRCLAHAQQPTIIALPEECRPALGTFRWKLASMSPVRTGVMGLMGLLVVAGFYWGGRPWSEWAEPATETASLPASDEPSLETADSGSPLTEWEATQTEIEALDKQLGQSEEDVDKLWGI